MVGDGRTFDRVARAEFCLVRTGRKLLTLSVALVGNGWKYSELAKAIVRIRGKPLTGGGPYYVNDSVFLAKTYLAFQRPCTWMEGPLIPKIRDELSHILIY